MIFMVLSIMTLCYFVLVSWQDLKERMLYTAPILFLHILWSIYLVVMTDWENCFLCSFWLVHLIIYVVLNDFGVWGDGDSDLFLLMGNLCLVASKAVSTGVLVFRECFFLMLGLLAAIGIGVIEANWKKKKLKVTYEIAVAPGMAVAGTILILQGFLEVMK